MSTRPRVSIGVPVYNGEQYLRECLESLLAQTFQDVEIIISDNCSADSTEEICREFAARDARIRYIRQTENLGAIANFNRVFAEAQGEYFKWAAYDDLCEPTFLERCVDALDCRSDAVWCHCDSDRIDDQGRRLQCEASGGAGRAHNGESRDLPRTDHDSASASRRFAGVILGTNWCVDAYGLIRSESLRQTRMLLPFYGAEKVLMGELALVGPYCHIPETLFSQRIHDVASSNIKSAAVQSEYMVGSQARRKKRMPARLSILTAHLRAAISAKQSLWQRVECVSVVVRYVFQFRKWKRVITAAVFGKGVGGDGIERLRKANASSSNGAA